jgi:hypothetical protein
MHTAQRFAVPDIASDIPTISEMVEGKRERDILDGSNKSIQLSPVKIFGEVPIAQTQAVPKNNLNVGAPEFRHRNDP